MPTGLDSAAAKILRAEEHLDAINHIIHKITSATDSYEILTDANGKETVNFLVEPPLSVSILAGEIVYQLCSALDHLVFELVKRNPGGIVLPPKWEENCKFPLWPNRPLKPPVDTCFNNALPGVSKTALTFIESLQPYNAGAGPHNVMRILAQLYNIDKHRHLNVILPRVAVRQDFRSSKGLNATSVLGGFKQGAEIYSASVNRGDADTVVDMKRSFLPYITFEETAIGTGPATLESQHVLEVCTETVKNIVVPAFIHFL